MRKTNGSSLAGKILDATMTSALFEASAEAFEQLGFMLPTEENTWEPASIPPEHAVLVGFHGALEGRLVVRVYGDVAGMLAGNMLGDDHAPDAIHADAVGELANVICGNALPRIAGEQALINIDTPRPLRPPPQRQASPSARIGIGLESGWADIELFLSAVRCPDHSGISNPK